MKKTLKNKALLAAIYVLGQINGVYKALDTNRKNVELVRSDKGQPEHFIDDVDTEAQVGMMVAKAAMDKFLEQIKRIDLEAYEIIQDYRNFEDECEDDDEDDE